MWPLFKHRRTSHNLRADQPEGARTSRCRRPRSRQRNRSVDNPVQARNQDAMNAPRLPEGTRAQPPANDLDKLSDGGRIHCVGTGVIARKVGRPSWSLTAAGERHFSATIAVWLPVPLPACRIEGLSPSANRARITGQWSPSGAGASSLPWPRLENLFWMYSVNDRPQSSSFRHIGEVTRCG